MNVEALPLKVGVRSRSLSRRTLGAFAALLLPAPAIHAQPIGGGRPLRIIVPYGPGSMNDVLARMLSNGLQARLGNPVVVENRTGASGTIAMNHVARSAPDGLTLALAASSDLTSIQFLQSNLGYNITTSFAPVIMISVAHNCLATPARVPARTLAELVAWLRANPGQTFASSAIGSNAHLGMEKFQRVADFRAEHILYRTGALQALITGEVSMFLQHELALRPHVEAGSLRLYAVASPQRLAHLPNLPTFVEEGFPSMIFQSWFGVVAPADTPAPIITQLNSEMNMILATSEGREALLTRGVEAVGGPPEVLAQRIAADTIRYGDVIRDANIQPQ
jgi:tripartite-type tricarboxylate transporter receptor subunit TctC